MVNVVDDKMYNQLKQLYGGDETKAQKAKSLVETSYSTERYNNLVSQLNNKYGTTAQTSTTSVPQTDGSRNAKANTGSVAPMSTNNITPINTSTNTSTSTSNKPTNNVGSSPSNGDIAKTWSGLTPEQQQNKLMTVEGLKEYLTSKGILPKQTTAQTTTPTQTTTTTPKTTATTPKTTTKAATTTPKQDQWDYQDNSQARMNEIANNLDRYRQTNPELFADESTFYNFFIKDKGRSQDQIDYLWDYFNKMKKYSKYDNLPASVIGDGLANGKIPQDYLTYIKSTDPAKYQEIVGYKQDAEDTIKNEGYLSSTAAAAGIEGWESEPSSIKYGKWNEIWMDEDNNGIDDRREHYASEEEQGYQKQIADLNAANLDIDNTVKHTYDDYVKKYPGATKATLMAMAQDTNADLLREKENNLVELTRLQGYVKYMQEERFEMNEAGADSIRQLQDNLKMYYQYSPEGLAELAQAQYGATNITLDQADSGNETQKQMALQNVLDGYYDKYGDIIQRSEQQVINDVIAYAKKNGVGLAEALQENFVKPLQSKPEFATLSTGRSISDGTSDKWSVTTVKDANGEDISVMYNQATGEIRNLGGGDYTGGGVSVIGSEAKTGYGKSYTVVSTEQLVGGLGDFLDGYEVGDKGGQCGAFVNNGLKKIGAITENIYDNSLDSKLKSRNENANTTAQTGWVAIRNPEKLSGNGAKYGHVGWVIKDNGDGTVKVVDSNGTKNANGEYDETVGIRDVSKSSLYGYFNPSKTNQASKVDYAKVLGWIPTQLRNTDVEKQWYLDIAQEQFEKGLTPFEAAMSIIGFDITNNSEKAQDIKNKVLDIIMKQGSDTLFNQSVLSSMASFINKGDYEGALETLENQLGIYMENKGTNGLYLDNVSTAVEAIDQLNQINDYKSWFKGEIANVKQAMNAEGKDTSKFYTWTSNIKSTMRALGYDDEDIENMLPKITYTKSEFEQKVANLEDAILGRYNQIRKNHGMPSIDSNSILNKGTLSDLYKIGYVKVEPYTGRGVTNLNLRYGLTAEKEAFNSI